MNTTTNGATAGTVTPLTSLNAEGADAIHHNSPEVYRAISQVAKAISRDGIAKARTNDQQSFKFRGIDDIMNALSALLAEARLCILPRMLSRQQEERQTASGKSLFYVTVQADFDFVSACDGSKHTVTMFGEAMDSADKATNKAMSAAYKYACLQVFCIPTEAMPDADQTTYEPAGKQPKKAAPNSQAAADHVAQQKIEELKTSGEIKRAFAKLREPLGELVYLGVLEKHGVKSADQFRDTETARACYREMLGKFKAVA